MFFNKDDFEDASFPCPLCNQNLDVRLSKKNKPYVICDYCGLQMFIRKHEGIERFKDMVDIPLF